jgi:hypothetical protein
MHMGGHKDKECNVGMFFIWHSCQGIVIFLYIKYAFNIV